MENSWIFIACCRQMSSAQCVNPLIHKASETFLLCLLTAVSQVRALFEAPNEKDRTMCGLFRFTLKCTRTCATTHNNRTAAVNWLTVPRCRWKKKGCGEQEKQGVLRSAPRPRLLRIVCSACGENALTAHLVLPPKKAFLFGVPVH